MDENLTEKTVHTIASNNICGPRCERDSKLEKPKILMPLF